MKREGPPCNNFHQRIDLAQAAALLALERRQSRLRRAWRRAKKLAQLELFKPPTRQELCPVYLHVLKPTPTDGGASDDRSERKVIQSHRRELGRA